MKMHSLSALFHCVEWGGESGGSEQPGSPGNIIFNKESVLDRRPATKELISTFQKCFISSGCSASVGLNSKTKVTLLNTVPT